MIARLLACAALVSGLVPPAAGLHVASPLPLPEGQPRAPVVIDAGHGGEDLGAVNHGLREKDLALVMAHKLRAKLRGLPVVMTREDDRYVTLDQRMVGAMDRNGAIFVSLHINQVKSQKLAGAVVFSYGPEKLRKWRPKRHPRVPPMPAPPAIGARESELLARSFVKAMRREGLRVEAAKSDYYVLKNPSQPSVLIELGYLSNPAEAARLSDPAHQDKLAETLARAIESYAQERLHRAEYVTAEAAAGTNL